MGLVPANGVHVGRDTAGEADGEWFHHQHITLGLERPFPHRHFQITSQQPPQATSMQIAGSTVADGIGVLTRAQYRAQRREAREHFHYPCTLGSICSIPRISWVILAAPPTPCLRSMSAPLTMLLPKSSTKPPIMRVWICGQWGVCSLSMLLAGLPSIIEIAIRQLRGYWQLSTVHRRLRILP